MSREGNKIGIDEARLDELREAVQRLRGALSATFIGQAEALDQVLWTVLAGGHVLLEGAPGLGKTTLVRTLASALDLSFRRIQFTPDLMPADILGSRILEETDGGRRFRFERGPLFAQIVLADEINRATPRTQSALLEAMQEHQVTVFGETLMMEEPFTVIATENPIEMEGTYPLPEAQLDRFLSKVMIHAPSERDLVAILEQTTGAPVDPTGVVLQQQDVLALRRWVREVPVSRDIVQRVARLVLATDPDSQLAPASVRAGVRYGASPRGGQAVLLLAKAYALVRGDLHVSSEAVEAVAVCALRHRVVLSYEGEALGVRPDELIAEALTTAIQGAS